MPPALCAHGVHPGVCAVPNCTGENVNLKELPKEVQKLLDTRARLKRADTARDAAVRARETALPDPVRSALTQLKGNVERRFNTRPHLKEANDTPPHQWDDVVVTGGGRLAVLPEEQLGVVHHYRPMQRWPYTVNVDGEDVCVDRRDIRRATVSDKERLAPKRRTVTPELPPQLGDWPRAEDHPIDELALLPHGMQVSAAEYAVYAQDVVSSARHFHSEVANLMREQAQIEQEIERAGRDSRALADVSLHPVLALPGGKAPPWGLTNIVSSEPAERIWLRKEALRTKMTTLQTRTAVIEATIAKMSTTLLSKSAAAPHMTERLKHELMFRVPPDALQAESSC